MYGFERAFDLVLKGEKLFSNFDHKNERFRGKQRINLEIAQRFNKNFKVSRTWLTMEKINTLR